MTEDKWIKILEEEEEHQKESTRIQEKMEESWKKNSLKNLPIFESNIERLNKILKNYNCQFGMPKEYDFETSESLLDILFYKRYSVSIKAHIRKKPIEYYCTGSKMPSENVYGGARIPFYTDFDKLIDDFIEAYKEDLIKLKV